MLSSLRPIQCLALTLAVVLPGPLAHAGTTFKREFAPQDGLLAPAEKAYRNEICLNGSWQFQPVALPEGYQRGKSPIPELTAPTDAGWEKTPIRIPSPWNVNGFPDDKGLGGDFRTYPSYPDAWKSVQMGWLRKTFNVPANWRGRRLVLHFDAVAGDTQVMVNGQTVGRHDDIFLPFDVDVTSAIQPGAVNTLLVGVRKSSLRDNQGKYGRRPYQGGSFWGQHIAGIWQDVYLEATPSLFIDNVFVQPLVDKGTLQVEVTVRNNTAQAQNVNLSGSVYPWISQAGQDIVSAPEPKWTLGKTAALQADTRAQSVPAGGSAVITLTGAVGNRLQFWSPDSPNLYGLVCGLNAGGRATDTKYTRFGWRQLTFKDGKTLLNGQPIVMKGDSWHFMGIPQMTRRYPWAWYRALKDANLNAVRLHAQPYPAFYLDVADEMGIMVLDETAIWASDGGPKLDDPAYWADTNRHVKDLVLRDRNHPSVFGWSVSNEVMAIIRGVFRGPKEMQDQLISHFGQWREICQQSDPTRLWVSADGEDDGNGALGTYVVHYGGSDSMRRASATGKPWGVGEAGPAYYATPQEIEKQSGNPRAYLSFQDRMEGVAVASYKNLMDQRQYGASYRSVFNLAWYGLKPLELGMDDTTKAPALTDGVFFPAFVEGKPGVQPERLGPYCTTLNPGYDPRLKLYETWPLFDAIRAAQAEPPLDYQPAHEFAFKSAVVGAAAPAGVKAVQVLAGNDGPLAKALSDLGVPVAEAAQPGGGVLFINGVCPPDAGAKADIQKTLDAGGTVVVWGTDAASLAQLNQLLPAPLELTGRTASSLVPAARDALVAGLTPASLYFSELNPPTITNSGLDGAFINQATPLLVANNTDWTSWNRQGEATKTARVMRSEREAKPSGVVLAHLAVGRGRFVVCNLPAAAPTAQATALNRAILTNLGIVLGEGVAQRNMLDPSGVVTRALAIGRYSAPSVEEAVAASPIAPNSGSTAAAGGTIQGRTWTSVATDATGNFDLRGIPNVNAQQASSLYLSFWLNSPKDLGNLLLDPNLPTLEMTTGAAAGVKVWVNSNAVPTGARNGGFTTSPLALQQGWNHVLVKVVRAPGDGAAPALKLQSSQPDYLTQLHGAQQIIVTAPEPPKVAVVAPAPPGLKTDALAAAEKGGGVAVASERDEKASEQRRFTVQGNWNYPGVWTTPEPENRAVWEANLSEAGQYRVEMWYDTDPNNDHATRALVRIAHADGEQQTRISQREKTTQWVDLGTYRFNKGWAKVTLDGENAGGNLIAGMVRFIPVR